MSDEAASGSTNRLKPVMAAIFGRKLTTVLFVLVLLLLILPEIIRLALIRWVPDTGVGELTIKDVDLNLFNATAGIEGLRISRDDETKLELDTLRIDASWLKLLVGEFHLERVVIDGLRLVVTQDSDDHWEVVIPLPGEPAAEPQPEPGDDGQPVNDLPHMLLREALISHVVIDVDSHTVKGQFALGNLTLENLSSWQTSPATLELQASWQQAPIALSLSVNPWIATPQLSGSLTLSSLPLAGIKSPDDEPLDGTVDMAVRFSSQQLTTGISATLQGDMGITRLHMAYKNIVLDQQQLSWQGSVDGVFPNGADTPVQVSVIGDLVSRGLSIRDRKQDLGLLSWESLSVESLAVDQGPNIAFSGLMLQSVAALASEDTDGRLYTGALDIRDFDWSAAGQLHISAVTVGQGHYNLVLDKDGRLRIETVLKQVLAGLEQVNPEQAGKLSSAANQQAAVLPHNDSGDVSETSVSEAAVPEAFAEASTAPSETRAQAQLPTPTDEQAGPSLQISVDKVLIHDDTRVNFSDLRFSVPVEQELIIDQLLFEHLDQQHPDIESLLSLKAKVGEFSTLTATGKAKPFADPIAVDLKGELKAMELPALSPYSEAYLGYHLSRGQYDHKFEIHIDGENINLANKLKLRQLALKPVDPDKPQPMEKQLSVPLGVALDMLRDGDDNIDLDVPIKGRLDQPDVNVNDVINDALANALKSGATSFLKFALQPYGAVLMAADFVGDQLSAVYLDPMLFTAGSDVVPETDYPQKLLDLMQQRPKLNLSFCGQANDIDGAALQAAQARTPEQLEVALVQLADRRAKNLKRQFVDKGADGSRLLLCQARYVAKGVNGVQLGL